jgi:hypothetical protein
MTARSGWPLLRLGLVVVLVVTGSGPGFSQRETSPDAATWNRRPPGVGDYRTVTEVSGRAELAQFRIPPDPRSLHSVCEARQEALAAAVPTLEQHLGPGGPLAHQRDAPGLPERPRRPGRGDRGGLDHPHRATAEGPGEG